MVKFGSFAKSGSQLLFPYTWVLWAMKRALFAMANSMGGGVSHR
jgi:hypothetical protein